MHGQQNIKNTRIISDLLCARQCTATDDTPDMGLAPQTHITRGWNPLYMLFIHQQPGFNCAGTHPLMSRLTSLHL